MNAFLRSALALGCASGAASAALTVVSFDGAMNTVIGTGSMTEVVTAATNFNTVSGYGLTAMDGGDRTVMQFPKFSGLSQGLEFAHDTPTPNTTGYTILLDVYFPTLTSYTSLLDLDNGSTNADGEIFARAAGIGINSSYAGGSIAAAWSRIVMTFDTGANTYAIWLNGSLVNSGSTAASGNNPDRYDLDDPAFRLFTDDGTETASGYISQFAFEDRLWSDGEIAALGGVSAAVIPEPSVTALLCGLGAAGMVRRRRDT